MPTMLNERCFFDVVKIAVAVVAVVVCKHAKRQQQDKTIC
jgi:hypothetical protein